MSETASCPGCASQVVFRAATTTLAVCAQCGTISARGGAKLEAIGQTNEVYATGTALTLGLRGSYANRPFTLVGRTQLAHDAGSVWDAWLVCYDDGRLAWLSESPWGLSLMGELPWGEGPRLDSPFDTSPGASHLTGVGELIVTEVGEATIVAEAGELPSRALPGSRRPFVDFTSRTGRCATLDFGAVASDGTREPKRFFVGRDVSLTELGLGHAKVNPPALPQGQEATALRCPHCSGPLAKPREGTQSLVCATATRRSRSRAARAPYCSRRTGYPICPRSRLAAMNGGLDQTAELRVEQVLGELTFRVSRHDTTYGSDFRDAPRTLSSERSERELTWSEGLDVPTAAVASTFGVTLPSPDEDDSVTDLPSLLLIGSVVLLDP